MSDIKASIIIPVYQAEKYIRRCLDSVTAQTYKDFEVVIIDDGSSDGSGEICDAYAEKDKRFRVIHQENQGVAAARYRGVEEARGEWLFWIDADDYADVHLVAKVMEVAEKEDADIVVWSTANCRNGKVIRTIKEKEQSLSQWQKDTIRGRCSTLWTFASRKDLWNQISYPLKMAHAGEDGVIAMQLFMKAKHVSVVTDVLYYYQEDTPHSLSHSQSSIFYFENYELWQNRLQVCEEKYIEYVDFCLQRTLSCAVKSYCLDIELKELTKEQKKELIIFLEKAKNCKISGRRKEKILSWAIRHGQDCICRLYSRHKLNHMKHANYK